MLGCKLREQIRHIYIYIYADPSGRSFAGIANSNPAGAWISVSVSVVCCQEGVSESCRSQVQRSPTECGVSECDRETSNKPQI